MHNLSWIPSLSDDRYRSRAHFRDLVLLTFGLYFQQMVNESRLVFYPLRVAPESLAEKALDVGLKLLPSLIRCPLIHGNYLLMFFAQLDPTRILTTQPRRWKTTLPGNKKQ
jgi:hypothetical protein